MKIDSSYIGMESARSYHASSTRKLSFRAQAGSAALNNDVNEDLENGLGSEDSLKNQKEGEEQLEEVQAQMNRMSGIRRIPQINLAEEENSLKSIRQQCVFYLWSLLFGSKSANDMAERMGMNINQNSSYSAQTSISSWTNTQTVQMKPIQTIAISAEEETIYSETENTSFSTTGTVRTADGREISFNLDLQMSRSFQQYTKKTATISNMIDPLVINLNGNIASVSDQKFYFDLDADGEEEAISRLCEDSGYLALDKNEDGKINDGSELFGTKSGDGFADLAEYDEDGNGWIDENDEIWDKLKIWVQDENGNSKLFSLADQGVGAICLQNASTDFSQRENSGEVSAAIRSTGIFLYENGGVGTIQHMDLAAQKIAKYA